ncbi:multiple sugar transport system permease protein [Labrenzia sp. EL_208]|uniref:Inner membrane ABC transporter permease protein YcjP n=1 Tax=Roseibium album TaxID=311410 RepID=A0A0M6Z896_9HYPH|nr:carbohydrate ABC transporter permease [Roseibium album]MBG6142261.1 multiple sugar transport system permease protein [Labrenzia sp. EL_142]MBG6160144.1 multiple sugar transport system permease protein [Labrenzia sp. EL_162]MBG6166181.1 multiple sugar transport system permease protein [Labrenzia sp. EL_195]MBG6178112.1 multiple sugar transport system permease protein [Labrenzia sp. EL_132]MBG6198676.1 multiple sugar transport system permease protein [Labrenzia sp. EL_159]MBG6232735.1 multip
MRPGSILIAAVTGLVWGVTAIVVIAVTLTLITGEVALPQATAAGVAGLASALVFVWRQSSEKSSGMPAWVWSAITLFLILMIGSFAAPFNLPIGIVPVWQGLALILFVLGATWATSVCLSGARLGPMSRYEREVVYIRVAKGIGFVVFTIIVALPFYVMVMTSLKSQQTLLANPLDLSIDFSQGLDGLLRSYVELFTQFNFGRYLLVSAYVSVATVVLTLLFSVPGAYAVSRLRFPGQAFLARSVLLIYMVPAIVLVIPLYAVFSQLGLRNTLTGLLVVYPATTIPVALYMLQGYFRGLPSELEEAGLMDGLSRVGVILKITLPLSLPALASVSLYVFMIAWNEFLFAFMFLDNPDIFTLSRGVVSLNSSEVPRQHLMAGAVIATVPVLVIFLWFERFLVQGLTAGSVKG